ncbi:PIPO, partial [Zucchini shoestring virus]
KNLRRELGRTMERIKFVGKMASKIVIIQVFKVYYTIFGARKVERFQRNIRLLTKIICERR